MSTGAELAMDMNMAQMINQSVNSNNNNNDPTEKLKKLKELLDLGAITEDDYIIKKEEYLKQL